MLSRSEYMIWHSRRNPHLGGGAEHGFGVATQPLDDREAGTPGVPFGGQSALHILRALSTNARIAALVASGMADKSRARSGGERSVPHADGAERFGRLRRAANLHLMPQPSWG
jgi:hypothetical protein